MLQSKLRYSFYNFWSSKRYLHKVMTIGELSFYKNFFLDTLIVLNGRDHLGASYHGRLGISRIYYTSRVVPSETFNLFLLFIFHKFDGYSVRFELSLSWLILERNFVILYRLVALFEYFFVLRPVIDVDMLLLFLIFSHSFQDYFLFLPHLLFFLSLLLEDVIVNVFSNLS